MSDTTNKSLVEIAKIIKTKQTFFIKLHNRIETILIDQKVTPDEQSEYDILIKERDSIKLTIDTLETQFKEKVQAKNLHEELKIPLVEVIDSDDKLQKAQNNLTLIKQYHEILNLVNDIPGYYIIINKVSYHKEKFPALHAKLNDLSASIQKQMDSYKKSDVEIISLEDIFTTLDNLYVSFENKYDSLAILQEAPSGFVETLSELKKIVLQIYSAIEQYDLQKSSRNYDNHKDSIVIYDKRIKEIKLELEKFEGSLPSLENTAMEKTNVHKELKHFDEIWQHLQEIEQKYISQKTGEKLHFKEITADLDKSKNILKELYKEERLNPEELQRGLDFIQKLQDKIEKSKALLITKFGDVKDINPEDLKSGKAAAPSLNRIKELKNNTITSLQNIAIELNSFCNHWEKFFLETTTAFSNGRAEYNKKKGDQDVLEKRIELFWSILQSLTFTLISAPIGTASSLATQNILKKQAANTTRTLKQKLTNIDTYYPDIAKDLGKGITKNMLSTVLEECIKNSKHTQVKIPSTQYLTNGIEKLNILKVDKASFYLNLKGPVYEKYIQLNTSLKELHQRIEAYYNTIPKDVYFYAVYHNNWAEKTKEIETQFLDFASEVDLLSEEILKKINLSKVNIPSKLQDDFELFCWAAYISSWEIHNLSGTTTKTFLADELVEYLDKKHILKNWGNITKEDLGNDLEQLWAATIDQVVGTPITDVGESALSLVQGAKKELKYYMSDKFWKEKLNLS